MAKKEQLSASISFESDQWLKALGTLQKKWDYMFFGQNQVRREFAGIVSTFVFSDIMDHFSKQQGDKGKWDAWSKAYAEHMQKIGKGGNNILQDSGKLRQSFTPQSYRLNNEGVLFYNNARTKGGFSYAQHHDEGRSSWKGNPRKFMWLSSRGINGIIEATVQWLKEGFGK